MVKVIALYRKPPDVADFEQKYFETHIPLVKKIPGLQRVEVNRITGTPRGEAEFYLIAELSFADRASLDKAMASPENMEAGKNLMGFAKGLVSILFAEQAAV